MLFGLKWKIDLVVRQNDSEFEFHGTWPHILKELMEYEFCDKVRDDLIASPNGKNFKKEIEEGLEYEIKIW